MIIADMWAAVGGVGSLLAAVAAAIAVCFAKATVDEARASRRDAERAHEQVLASHRAQLEAVSAAHEQQMAQRANALADERRLEIVRQLQRIAIVLLQLADCARDEAINPPARLSDVSPIPLTRIPGLLAALRASTAPLVALHGPDLQEVRRVVDHGYQVGAAPMHFLGEALTGLREVEMAIASLDSADHSAGHGKVAVAGNHGLPRSI